ncbi:hypothetical protein LCGC14_1318860, partial [marine sediment metagenome]
ITGEYGMPYLFVSDKLDWRVNEINDYYWKKNPMGEQMDKPMDKDDHAMDTSKYMLTNRPNISKLTVRHNPKEVGWRQWGERDLQEHRKSIRYG